MKTNRDRVGIYLHIPFCIKKCNYCDFLSFGGMEQYYNDYVNMLCKQIDEAVSVDSVSSVYFGGGTPSILKAEMIAMIMERLSIKYHIERDAEITLECNPKTADKKAMETYRASGINRLSLGLQSFHDEELSLLGRVHNVSDFLKAFSDARDAGFNNINVDIMTALPGQTKDILTDSLEKVCELKPEHISAYSLILEVGTPFYDRYHDSEASSELPSESEERELYYLTRDLLTGKGYRRYEISNFALPGFESVHNSSYWIGRDYLGFGLGASGLFHGKRYKNTSSLQEYLKNPSAIEESISLSREDCMEEFMFLGLRRMEGICLSDFQKRFGVTAEEIYGDTILKLIKNGLLIRNFDRILLSDKGVDYGNYVFSEFLLS